MTKCFPYFDESFFVYTGEKGENQLVMKFQQDILVEYKKNDFTFIQKFAEYSYQLQRLNKNDLTIIVENANYKLESIKNIPDKGFRWA